MVTVKLVGATRVVAIAAAAAQTDGGIGHQPKRPSKSRVRKYGLGHMGNDENVKEGRWFNCLWTTRNIVKR